MRDLVTRRGGKSVDLSLVIDSESDAESPTQRAKVGNDIVGQVLCLLLLLLRKCLVRHCRQRAYAYHRDPR